MRETLKLSFHITRRNWMVYKKDLIANMAPTMIEPFLLMMSIGVGVGHFIATVDGRSYISFLAPGLAVSTALFTAFFESSYGFYVRLTFENIFHAMLATPIGPREVIFGEFIWVAIKGAAMFTLLSGLFAAFGLMSSPALLLAAPLVGVLVALPCGSMGLLATSYVRNINQFQTIYAFFISPLFYFSGIFFPMEQMPAPLQTVARCLPLYHGVRLAQSLFWGESPLETFAVHGSILVGFSGFFCAWAYFRIRSRLP